MDTKTFEIKATKNYGNGIFAKKNIKKGDVIYTLNGKTMSLSELVEKVLSHAEAANDPLQVGKRTYIDLDDISRTFNHSCEPNCGLRKRSELFALRNIQIGEQITYDYSTTISPTDWTMKCKCGSKKCRRNIHDIASIPKKQLEYYINAGALQRYFKPIINSISNGTYKIPKYEILALEKLGDMKSE